MRHTIRWLTPVVVVALGSGAGVGGCAGRSRDGRPPRIDRTVLAREQMLKARYNNVYDAVAAMRPNWLRPRGPESFTVPTVVWVYLDEQRLGDVETLRNIQTSQVSTVRFYDGPSATGRWGVGHNAGVIHVSTWSEGALGFPRSNAVPADWARWVGTWAAAPTRTDARDLPPAPGLAHRTLRQVVQTSLGGRRVRVRFSNRFGSGPLTIEDAHLALAAGDSSIRTLTDVAVTFRGQRGVTLRAGESVVSDAVEFDVAPLTDVAVTTRFGDVPAELTGHPRARATSYLQDGDWLDARAPSAPVRVDHWYVLSGLDVALPGTAAAVAVVGVDPRHRWTDDLARRLQDAPRTREVAVIDASVAGGCVLRACAGPSTLERLDPEALQQRGVRWLVVGDGVHDIGAASAAEAPAVADSLVAAYRRLIAAAKRQGMCVYGATIPPFGGSAYDTPEREAARARVNAWIRTGRAFDAVIDLDAELLDSARPTRLRPDVDDGDHLHLNERGRRVIADAIDLGLFAR
jgi:lysophospholipase L1-like esterase